MKSTDSTETIFDSTSFVILVSMHFIVAVLFVIWAKFDNLHQINIVG